jgi:hypothetical protein
MSRMSMLLGTFAAAALFSGAAHAAPMAGSAIDSTTKSPLLQDVRVVIHYWHGRPYCFYSTAGTDPDGTAAAGRGERDMAGVVSTAGMIGITDLP